MIDQSVIAVSLESQRSVDVDRGQRLSLDLDLARARRIFSYPPRDTRRQKLRPLPAGRDAA